MWVLPGSFHWKAVVYLQQMFRRSGSPAPRFLVKRVSVVFNIIQSSFICCKQGRELRTYGDNWKHDNSCLILLKNQKHLNAYYTDYTKNLWCPQKCQFPCTSSSRLEELFLCLNGYNSVSESQTTCPSLRLLQITDNQLQDWAEVRKFGLLYPSLSTLVLANNSVDSVGDTKETLEHLFPNLRSINLNNSGRSPKSLLICLYSVQGVNK